MSRPQHTPGPWRYSADPGSNYVRITCSSDLAEGDNLRGYCGPANARLIAAAPDLLAAVQALDDTFSHYCDGDPSPEEWAALQAARAAIAKARGEA